MTIEQLADTTYSNQEVLDFELILDTNYNTNPQNFHLCIPINSKKLSNAAQNLTVTLFPVNNFFT